jgi:thioredoxin-related protein
MPDLDGMVVDLYSIQASKTLLVFYSSQCPHCQILLPQLNESQKRNNDLKIVAVSLDDKKDQWLKFVGDNNLEMININDPNGWEGDLASIFYIYATPTMFLLDGQKKIISKPVTYEDLLGDNSG